jgi:uncharacterized protein (DUF1697 family)
MVRESSNMQTLISLLRGINMAGHNSIKMSDLSNLYKDLGFTYVETYIQSGNVIFCYGENEQVPTISNRIEKAILERFDLNIPVMIRTVQEMKDLSSSNYFLSEEDFDPAKMAVIFLHEKCKESQIKKVADVNYPPDRFFISGSEIFIYCPDGFGRTKIYTNFFEKKMGVIGTGRNWKTITTLLDIAQKKIA